MRAFPALNPHYDLHYRFATSFETATFFTGHCSTRAAQNIKMHHGPTFDLPSSQLPVQSLQPSLT